MSIQTEALHRDHANMNKLLDLLEAQIARLRAAEPTDYILMSQILDYMASYPGSIHHPREDVIYRRLMDTHPDAAQEVRALFHEHRELEDLTSELSELLHSIAVGEIIARDRVEKVATAYVDRSRRHMVLEEEHVYPLIESRLSDTDWSAIESQAPSDSDPLFSDSVQDSFRSLYRKITGERH